MLDRREAELETAKRIVSLARTQQLTLLSAGVAFYAFISLVPLMLLALGIAATLGGETLANRITAAANDVLTPAAQELLAETLVDETGRQSATVVGALGVLWGSSRVFRGLDRAFSAVYGTVASKSFLDTFWDAAVVLLVIAVGLTLVGTLEVLVEFVPLIRVIGPLFIVLGLFVAFLPLYVVFPDAGVDVREAAPGTLLAAVGWYVLSHAFSLYVDFAGGYALYGALGAVFLVLIWLYAGAIILVFGAVCNAVLADREVDRQLQSPGARQIRPEAMTDDATGADEGTPADRSDPTETTASDGPDGPTDEFSRAGQRRASARTRDRSDDPEALREEIERLRDRVDTFESNVERRTVERDSLEGELKRYVRGRVRHSHAHGWGPYLVLLYGTLLAIAAFRFLDGGWAILAMFVVWTSTLGVYILMVLIGAGVSLLGLPGRLRNRIGQWRS
ncbi:YihY/virulence factor BrkB family protein [Natrialba asiatica]|uniref:Ribonuclease BN n=1 Tax=Natrialba asiatica (strain ATCC 700177 / DSM 12278 / JCM 9576 / FERM P-10747 / NBRC 102637 / 172P1) TaxID=29540 RepID=M0B1E9_NATA1|nr:YihY/virulence factor BrkB family protein [Natrialba asiatica]ELZ04053.1 ribonuclease BN [Natrialba asiatica DSM 12278]